MPTLMKREKNESTFFSLIEGGATWIWKRRFGIAKWVPYDCLFIFVILKLSCEILFAYYAIKFQLLQTLETEF